LLTLTLTIFLLGLVRQMQATLGSVKGTILHGWSSVDSLLTSTSGFLARNVGSLCAVWIAALTACNRAGLLRGRTPDHFVAHFLVRSVFYSLLWVPINYLHPIMGKFMLLYAPLYLDLSEHYGSTAYTVFYPTWLKNWLTKVCKADVICDQKQPVDGQCVFGLHPHGILPIGSILNLSSVDFSPSRLDSVYTHPKRVILAATSCFLVPGWRELLLALNVFDCSRSNAERWLNRGYSICIVPGGAREGLYSNPDIDWLDLKRKRGFVRLALRYGVRLVPTYTFNEVSFVTQVHYTSFRENSVSDIIRRTFQQTFGISFPFVTGLKFYDDQRKVPRLVTAVGSPIACPRIENPSDEEVDVYLQKYADALSKLYETYGPQFNSYKSRTLQIS
jgi:hypothetical protein